MRILASAVLIFTAMSVSAQFGQPKKLLVVTTTAGFRHDIETVERAGLMRSRKKTEGSNWISCGSPRGVRMHRKNRRR